MHIPSAPKWDPTVDGLDMRDFSRQALEFERSLLPRGIAFPREGQIWRVIRECEVTFLALFSSGSLGPEKGYVLGPGDILFPFGVAQLQRGEEVRILALEDPRPLNVTFLPLRYVELEAVIVPASIRAWPGYTSYQLTAPTARTTGFEKQDYFTDCLEAVEKPTGGA
ncbi:MAG: hypothetical protein AB9869_34875 [Verrucomicrobiia bacterium]